MHNINILCVHPGYELYGSGRSFLSSLQAIKKNIPGARVTALIPQPGPLVKYLEPIVDALLIVNIGVLRKGELKQNPLKVIWKIIKGVWNVKKISADYDIIYVNTIVIADYIIASRIIKSKSIIHVREITQGIQKIIFSLMLKISGSFIIFNSKKTRDSFRFLNYRKCGVVLNGVRGCNNVEELKLPKPQINLLVIGRFNSWKGQDFFIDALNILDEFEKKRIRVRIVGDVFEDRYEFKEVIYRKRKQHSLTEIIEILPFTEKPIQHYMWSDIVVVPSTKPESFGRVAIEAMSAGRCVVAAAHGGILEIVKDKKTGLLFEPGNKHSLAEAIRWLLNNQDSIGKFGREAKIRFQDHFSEERYISEFGTLFKKAAGL